MVTQPCVTLSRSSCLLCPFNILCPGLNNSFIDVSALCLVLANWYAIPYFVRILSRCISNSWVCLSFNITGFLVPIISYGNPSLCTEGEQYSNPWLPNLLISIAGTSPDEILSPKRILVAILTFDWSCSIEIEMCLILTIFMLFDKCYICEFFQRFSISVS